MAAVPEMFVSIQPMEGRPTSADWARLLQTYLEKRDGLTDEERAVILNAIRLLGMDALIIGHTTRPADGGAAAGGGPGASQAGQRYGGQRYTGIACPRCGSNTIRRDNEHPLTPPPLSTTCPVPDDPGHPHASEAAAPINPSSAAPIASQAAPCNPGSDAP